MFDCICAVLRGSVFYISCGLSAVKMNKELLLLLLLLSASVGVPNFIGIESSAAELSRHSDFQDGGRQLCWIWFSVMAVHPRSASGGSALSSNFGLIGYTVLEIVRASEQLLFHNNTAI